MTWKLEVTTKEEVNWTIYDLTAEQAKSLVLGARKDGITIFAEDCGAGHYIHPDNILQVFTYDGELVTESLFKNDDE